MYKVCPSTRSAYCMTTALVITSPDRIGNWPFVTRFQSSGEKMLIEVADSEPSASRFAAIPKAAPGVISPSVAACLARISESGPTSTTLSPPPAGASLRPLPFTATIVPSTIVAGPAEAAEVGIAAPHATTATMAEISLPGRRCWRIYLTPLRFPSSERPANISTPRLSRFCEWPGERFPPAQSSPRAARRHRRGAAEVTSHKVWYANSTKMKLLVTGGAGFIGSNFVHYWIRHHPDDRLVVLDALTYAGNQANLEPVMSVPSFRFVHGDICDGERVAELLREEQIDTIVHFAAESHVDRSIHG